MTSNEQGRNAMAWNRVLERAGLERLAKLVEAAGDATPVSGLTHNFYRYPARFSPKHARAAIEAFTEPGDLVLDPFVGGGTTLVEAMVLGRHAIGADISSLATFVSEVKTTLYTEPELEALKRWADRVGEVQEVLPEVGADIRTREPRVPTGEHGSVAVRERPGLLTVKLRIGAGLFGHCLSD